MILKPKQEKSFEDKMTAIDMGLKIIRVAIALLIVLISAFTIRFIKDNPEIWKHLL